MSDLFQAAGNADPAYHALIIGVSRYPHLSGGTGPLTDEPLAAGLTQLRAAATSAVRVAAWIRDNLEHPTASKGSIRLLVSPSDNEVPLPHGITAPPATYQNASDAITAWRRDVRANADNLAILYIAGHGIQTGFGGGILLLEDFGAPNAPTPLHAAIDVESVRRGIVADPNRPATATPKLQFYFYDACRIDPEATASYETLSAGIRLDGPRGPEAEASWVCFGARPKDYAFADPARRATLYSQALIECLESRAPVENDGCTVQFNELTSTLRQVVKDLGRQYGEEQRTTLGGDGDLDVAVHRRPQVAAGAGMPIPAWAPTFDVDSPLGQLRFVRIAVHPQRPVSVRLAGNILASETRMLTDKPLELAVGNYEAVVPLPWGGEHVHGFVVTPGDSELVIDVEVPSDQLTAPPELGLVPMPWYIRFFRWADGAFRLHESPPPLQSYTPSAGVNDLHRLTIRDMWTAPVFFQIESDGGQQSPMVALPIGGGRAPCEVYVGVGFDKVTAIARPGDEEVNTIAGYLNSGRADRAVMSMATTAEDMLREKMADPIGAIIGGYALLKLHELDRMHNWPDNLAEIFDLLPDGPVIAGVLAARRGDDEVAAGWFRTAIKRGIPIFSEGLSLLAAESNALRQPQLGDALDIAEVARTAAALAPLADFSALCTTLHVHERLMADVPPNAGWKQVGPPRGDFDRGWVDR